MAADRQTWWRGWAILLVALAAYVPAWRAGFIWDDDTLLTANPLIQDADGWWRVWVTTAMPQYFPVTWTTFWVEWRLWGMNATGYHVTNILLHAAGCVLLWRLLLRLNVPGAWLAGLLFAVHPVNVESVAWISERKNVLTLVFFLAAWLRYLRFEETGHRLHYNWTLALFVLAVLSKSTAVVLPVAILLGSWWQRGRWERRDWQRVAPLLAIGLVAGLVSLGLQGRTPVVDDLSRIQVKGSVWMKIQTFGSAIWFYLGKAIWPVGLAPFYRHPHPDPGKWLDYVPAALVIVTAGVLWWRRRGWGKPLAVAGAFYLVALAPVVGLGVVVSWRAAPRADHLQHIALLAVCALVAGGVTRWVTGWQRAVVATGLVVVLGVLTWRQCLIYESSITYWSAGVQATPRQTRVQYNLGAAYFEAGRLAEAEAQFRKTIVLRPNHALAHFNLGNVLLATGRRDEARAAIERASELAPLRAEFRLNLAKLLAQENRWTEAVAQYEIAAAKLPQARAELTAARYNHGVTLGKQHDWSRAAEEFRLVIAEDPGHAAAHFNLALALVHMQQPAAALPHAEAASRLNPGDPQARALAEELRKARRLL